MSLQESRKAIVAAVAPWWTFAALFEVLWLIFYGRASKSDFAISGIALIFGAFCFIQALFAVNGPVPTPFSLSERALASAGSAMNGAWLSVASCIGVLTVVDNPNTLVELGGLVLAVCAGAAVFISWKTSSVVYPLVLVWALVALLVAEDKPDSVNVFAIVGICISVVSALVATVRKVVVSKAASAGTSDQMHISAV
jgi:hypothetical protein